MKRALIPTFCFAVLSSVAFEEKVFAAQSETADSEKVYKTTQFVNVSSGSLNLRKSASTSAPVITSLKKGTEVTVYTEANGWSKVRVNGKEGYVNSSYLTSKKSGQSSSTTQKATAKFVNVSSGSLTLRKGASTSAQAITTLKKGTEVTVYSEANGWSRVWVNGKEGYVSSSYLTSKKIGPDSRITPKTSTKFVNVSSGSLTLRKGASTSAQAITTLKKGTEVTVYSEANGWSRVWVNGKEGYVSSSYLTSKKTGQSPTSTQIQKATTMYVNVSSGSLNMRKTPSTKASIIVKLSKGKEVKVYSESNGWAKIEVFGQVGYVSSKYLSSSKSSKSPNSSTHQTSTSFVNVSMGSSLNMRKAATKNATVLNKLKKGTEVIVYSEVNGWSKIKVNGLEGYVSSEYLTAVKPSSEKMKEQEQKVETKYVNVNLGSSLNMRNRASTNSSIFVKLAQGVEVTVFSETNGWAKVKAYGKIGYVSSKYLSSTKPSAGSKSNTASSPDKNDHTEIIGISKYVDVMHGSTLNMRSKASTSASIIMKLARGTAVNVNSEENNWARISADGKTGYVSSQYLSTEKPFDPNSSNKDDEKTTEYYDITLRELTDIQMAVYPQTDKKYNTYIREDALTLNSSTSGTVNGVGWKVRGGAGSNHWEVGTVSRGETLQIISKVMGSDGYNWYQVNYDRTWVKASPDDVTYYLDPNNFLRTSVDSLQFLKLSVPANLKADEVNNRILAGKGSLQGLASAFITAGEKYNVNEIYLISHALLETGNGTSQLAKGIQVNGKTVYNMFGIGAYDGSALKSGAQHAFNAGWFSKEAAIIGGAQFISRGYIDAGQDTLYKMRWNPKSSSLNGNAAHQYATDIGWAVKQVNQINNLYSLIDSYQLVLDVPVYKK